MDKLRHPRGGVNYMYRFRLLLVAVLGKPDADIRYHPVPDGHRFHLNHILPGHVCGHIRQYYREESETGCLVVHHRIHNRLPDAGNRRFHAVSARVLHRHGNHRRRHRHRVCHPGKDPDGLLCGPQGNGIRIGNYRVWTGEVHCVTGNRMATG